MGIIMGADTATNIQPAASPGRWAQVEIFELKNLTLLYIYKKQTNDN